MANKEELQSQLKEKGITFHHMHGEKTLQRLLDDSEPVAPAVVAPVEPVKESEPAVEPEAPKELSVEEKIAVAEVMKVPDAATGDSIMETARPVTGGHLSKGGVYLPHEATRHIRNRKNQYEVQHAAEESVVFKNGKELRRYDLALHGEDYQKLAEMFVQKHSNK